jgi:hypothetical protein
MGAVSRRAFPLMEVEIMATARKGKGKSAKRTVKKPALPRPGVDEVRGASWVLG